MLVTFLWRVWLMQAMVFTKEDRILIKVLRQSKGYSARKLLDEFPDKDWFCSALDWLLRQIDAIQGLQTGSPAAAENVRSAQNTCQCLCKWRPLWAQTVTYNNCVRTVEATFPYWKLLFLSSIFKRLLFKNCAVDFVEICNICARKVIIKAAKRIFNSDKICRSYCDFYFGVTFLEHTVYSLFPQWQRSHNRVHSSREKWTEI